jgi:hypothetical protein
VLSYAEVSEAVTPIMTADSERHVVSAPGDWLEATAS